MVAAVDIFVVCVSQQDEVFVDGGVEAYIEVLIMGVLGDGVDPEAEGARAVQVGNVVVQRQDVEPPWGETLPRSEERAHLCGSLLESLKEGVMAVEEVEEVVEDFGEAVVGEWGGGKALV